MYSYLEVLFTYTTKFSILKLEVLFTYNWKFYILIPGVLCTFNWKLNSLITGSSQKYCKFFILLPGWSSTHLYLEVLEKYCNFFILIPGSSTQPQLSKHDECWIERKKSITNIKIELQSKIISSRWNNLQLSPKDQCFFLFFFCSTTTE